MKKRPTTKTQRELIKQTFWTASERLDKLFTFPPLSKVISLYTQTHHTHQYTDCAYANIPCPSKDIWVKMREGQTDRERGVATKRKRDHILKSFQCDNRLVQAE